MHLKKRKNYLGHQLHHAQNNLQRFLRILISGKAEKSESERTELLVSSIGQHLCRAATKGQWKLPKHILVCMTLRNLFRSAKLSILMNKLGHSESYSFSLKRETALAEALKEAHTLLALQIIRNPHCPSFFHSDFDNFDQFVNDLSGTGSIYTCHEIMLQNISCEPTVDENKTDSQAESLLSLPRTEGRSLKSLTNDTLPPCYMNTRDSPKMTIFHLTLVEYEDALSKSMLKYLLWCICRLHSSTVSQHVPGWAPFISESGQVPKRLTTIDYYPINNPLITDYSTVQECLAVSKNASREFGPKYAVTTFDLGVCMKAYLIIWKNPEFYDDYIVMIVSFRLICAYLKMISKKMNEPELADVLLETGIMSVGSMNGVMSGKTYSRAINCHKVMAESLERLLLDRYLETRFLKRLPGDLLQAIDHIINERTSENLDAALQNKVLANFLEEYFLFRQQVHGGSLGKTSEFWLTYMNYVSLVFSLLYAVKINDYYLYGACSSKMVDLFFSFDGQSYVRYLLLLVVLGQH